MTLPVFTQVLWAAGVIGNLFLCSILCMKGRWRKFPIFTALAAFEVTRAIGLFGIDRDGASLLYAQAYWATEAISFSLQIALMWELAVVMSRAPSRQGKCRTSKLMSTPMVILAFVIALVFSHNLHSSGSRWHVADMHASIFASLVTCELYLLLSLSANQLGIQRKQHAMAICNGLAVWSSWCVLTDVLHQGLGWEQGADMFEQCTGIVTLFVLGYWIRSFWFAEGLKPALLSAVAQPPVTVYGEVLRQSGSRRSQ